MKKKFLAALALSLAFVSSFSACGKPDAQNIEFDVPTYEDDKAITIGVWNGSRHDLTDMELYNLQQAGIDLLVGANPTTITEVDLIDRSADFGINVLIDQRPWNGQVPEYIDRDNFWGYCVYDEPTMGQLLTLQKMEEEYSKVMQDKMFFVNLLPSGGQTVEYYTYLNTFVEGVNLPVLSYDNYSIMLDPETGEVSIRETYLFDFDVAAFTAKEAGVPLWYTLLTADHLNYADPTTTDLEWQMYLAMTYGAQALIHYVYATHDVDYEYPIVDMSGNPTEKYYKVKEADATIRSWDHIFMNFEWLGTACVEGTENSTGLLDWPIYTIDVEAYDRINSVTATEDVIIGHFEDKDSNAGMMITNVTNPIEGLDSEVCLELNAKYKGALVIHEGNETVVALENGKLELEIPSGSAMFVIPLEEKK